MNGGCCLSFFLTVLTLKLNTSSIIRVKVYFAKNGVSLSSMVEKCFVDTDVIIDLLSQRQPHFHFAALLFTFAEMGKIELYTSPTVMVNTFYVLRKQLWNESAKSASRKLRLLINIIDSNEKVINLLKLLVKVQAKLKI